jgi:hypothetical protein
MSKKEKLEMAGIFTVIVIVIIAMFAAINYGQQSNKEAAEQIRKGCLPNVAMRGIGGEVICVPGFTLKPEHTLNGAMR